MIPNKLNLGCGKYMEKVIPYKKYKEENKLFRKTFKILKGQGLKRLVLDGIDFVWHYIIPRKKFVYGGKVYKSFVHWYNPTWRGDREVEIPIILDLIKEYKNKNILEVGNVLQWYTPIHHEVVDKYEIAGGVINQDIINFKPKKKYDLIISISTLEHVGYEEEEKDGGKAITAIKHLSELLNKNGLLFFTIPLGYNLILDKFVLNHPKIHKKIMTKINNIWVQIPIEEYTKNKRGFCLFGYLIKN